MMKMTMKNLGLEDDEGFQMELKAYEDIRNGIKEEPTVNMEPKWIPCTSDTMPEDCQRVLTTISIPNREPKVRSGYYHDGLFSNDNGDCWRNTDVEVTAWKPLDEPYQEESKESE